MRGAWLVTALLLAPAPAWACMNRLVESRYEGVDLVSSLLTVVMFFAPILALGMFAVVNVAAKLWKSQEDRLVFVSSMLWSLAGWLFLMGGMLGPMAYMLPLYGLIGGVIASVAFGVALRGKILLADAPRAIDPYVCGVMLAVSLTFSLVSLVGVLTEKPPEPSAYLEAHPWEDGDVTF